jgi:general secretion pathway protein C
MSNTLITQLNNPVALQKFNRRSAIIASILLVIACAYVLANFTWMLFPQPETDLKPVAMNIRSNTAQYNPQAEFQRLTRSNLLGAAQSKPVATQQDAPETRLNLTLKGVLAATPMRLASAIIAEGNRGDEEIYTVGDSLSGGVLVKEIHADYVLLERNGQLEKLKLPKDTDGSNGDNQSSLNSLVSSRYSGGTGPGQALKEIRTNIMKNPTSFADYAVPVVVREHGKQIGYRLQPQAKGELLSKLGLQRSDVITEVNGVKLDKQQNAISALRKLSTASSLAIMVKRNGAEVPLNISLQ